MGKFCSMAHTLSLNALKGQVPGLESRNNQYGCVGSCATDPRVNLHSPDSASTSYSTKALEDRFKKPLPPQPPTNQEATNQFSMQHSFSSFFAEKVSFSLQDLTQAAATSSSFGADNCKLVHQDNKGCRFKQWTQLIFFFGLLQGMGGGWLLAFFPEATCTKKTSHYRVNLRQQRKEEFVF